MEVQAKTTNLTKMPLNKAILTMALPAAFGMLVESLYHLVDAFWIGKLGALPLAAVSATSFLIWMMFSLGDIAGVAVNALVARSVGAEQLDRLKEHIRNSIVVCVGLSLLIAISVFPFREQIFSLIGLTDEVTRHAENYLTPWLFCLPIIMLVMPLQAVFRGVGDAKTPVVLGLILVFFNAVLDPLFIFGAGFIPAMGVAGAAWVTVINHFLYVIIAIYILNKRGLWPHFKQLHCYFVKSKDLIQIFKIGLPIALNGALFSLTYIGLTWVIAHFGSNAIAAIGIGHRMESFPWFISYGFSVAAASLVGQYLGANQPERAMRAVIKSSAIAFFVVLMFTIVMLLFVEPVVRVFINDAAVIAEAAIYLRIVAVCWLFGVFEVVFEGAFSGSGHTMPALLIGVPFTVIRIPLAYLLAITYNMEATGVWLAIGVTMIIKGCLMSIWFFRGKWAEID